MTANLIKVSIAGADGGANPADLTELVKRYPFVEWAVLYHADKEGTLRYPGSAWRADFLREVPDKSNNALHLCGNKVFNDILEFGQDAPIMDEVRRYGRVQVNINQVAMGVNDAKVSAIYDILLDSGATLIIQNYPIVEKRVQNYLDSKPVADLSRIHVLHDFSGGKGIRPARFEDHALSRGVPVTCGWAGGLDPYNFQEALNGVQRIAKGSYWLDLESGARNPDNTFSIEKARSILEITRQFLDKETAC